MSRYWRTKREWGGLVEFLKHPVGWLGVGVLAVALAYTHDVSNGPLRSGAAGPAGSAGRETQSDGYAWTTYCENLRLDVFDMKSDERFVIAHRGRVYPRYQEQYDRMVAADCDPAKGGFPGFYRQR